MARKLSDVLITDQLATRMRGPDYEVEARALGTLAAQLAKDPQRLLQAVVDLTITVCRAHSAGVSILDPTEDPPLFRWHAVAGALARNAGDTMPRDASLCGNVLFRDEVLLFDRPARYFESLRGVTPIIHEALLAPWHRGDEPIATLWAFAHSPRRHFDAEDARLLQSLARVAAAAWQVTLTHETQTRDATAAYRRSQEQLRSVVESIRDYAVIATDAEGVITSWNETAARIFGYSPAEVMGHHIAMIFTPEDRDAGVPLKEMRTAAVRGRAEDERWHLHASGRRIYISGVVTALLSGGTVTGFVKVARDTTLRKAREVSLQHSHNELEERVRQRTVELTDLATVLQEEARGREVAEGRIKGLFTRLVTVQEDERRRIARDIHDQIGQQITALRMHLDNVRRHCQTDPSAADSADRAVRLAKALDEGIDYLTWDLRPAVLDHLGLAAALKTLVRGWADRFGVAAQFNDRGDEEPRLPEHVETHLYRIAQEALHNIYRHADARTVAVMLDRTGSEVKLVIEDDGCGFDPEGSANARAGLGLLGMRERAGLIGGDVQIESSPGNGTTVYVRVPMASAA